MEYQIKKANILKSLAVLTMICLSCSSCNKEDDISDSEGAKIKGSVTITSISAQKKTTTGLQINVSIKASGVSTDEVRMLEPSGVPLPMEKAHYGHPLEEERSLAMQKSLQDLKVKRHIM